MSFVGNLPPQKARKLPRSSTAACSIISLTTEREDTMNWSFSCIWCQGIRTVWNSASQIKACFGDSCQFPNKVWFTNTLQSSAGSAFPVVLCNNIWNSPPANNGFYEQAESKCWRNHPAPGLSSRTSASKWWVQMLREASISGRYKLTFYSC